MRQTSNAVKIAALVAFVAVLAGSWLMAGNGSSTPALEPPAHPTPAPKQGKAWQPEVLEQAPERPVYAPSAVDFALGEGLRLVAPAFVDSCDELNRGDELSQPLNDGCVLKQRTVACDVKALSDRWLVTCACDIQSWIECPDPAEEPLP